MRANKVPIFQECNSISLKNPLLIYYKETPTTGYNDTRTKKLQGSHARHQTIYYANKLIKFSSFNC